MSDHCTACGLCVAACAAFAETGDESVTAQGREWAVQAGHDPSELGGILDSCHHTLQCLAACPYDLDLVGNFTRWRRQAPDASTAEFSRRWQQGGTFTGNDLPEIEPRTGSILLLLGCSFLEMHTQRLKLVLRALDRLQLDWGWKKKEACCGSFLEDVGAGLGSKPRPYTGERPIATLDSSCAVHIPRTLSLWDEALARPDLFQGLAGKSLRVGASWGNAESTRRVPLARTFAKATGSIIVNLDPMGRFLGDSSEDWRVRAGFRGGLQLPVTEVVLEPIHLAGDNRWLLEFLL